MRQQGGEPFLALEQRPCREILAVEIKKIEQEEHQAGGVTGVGRHLDMLNEVMPSARTPHSSPSR